MNGIIQMANALNKTLLVLSLSLFAGSLMAAPAPAGDAPKASAKAKPKAKAKKAKADTPAGVTAEDEPNVKDDNVADYNCELGNKVTVYTNDKDEEHIAVRWKQRLHRLTRVGTTTGAKRFENKNYGLIWIGIPAKGMLLDSRQNRQLANECKTAEQAMASNSAANGPVAVKTTLH
jgi:membrane-bound inhibitor of C-type lysozyme